MHDILNAVKSFFISAENPWFMAGDGSTSQLNVFLHCKYYAKNILTSQFYHNQCLWGLMTCEFFFFFYSQIWFRNGVSLLPWATQTIFMCSVMVALCAGLLLWLPKHHASSNSNFKVPCICLSLHFLSQGYDNSAVA